MGSLPFLVMLIGFATVVYWYLKNLTQNSDGEKGLFSLKASMTDETPLDAEAKVSKLKKTQQNVSEGSNWRHKSNLKTYRKLEDE